MLAPKLGQLSIIVDSWKPDRQRDILFVPVSITYDNVVEDEAFGNENSGGSKVKESIGSTVRAFDVFRKPVGYVHICVGTGSQHYCSIIKKKSKAQATPNYLRVGSDHMICSFN